MINIKNASFSAASIHPLFDEHPEALRLLTPNMRTKCYENAEVLVRHGDTAHSLWLVLDGWVKLNRQTPDGKETVVGLCTKGDIFGEAALFPGASYPYQAEVIGSQTTLQIVPTDAIQAAIRSHLSFSSRLMEMLNDRNSQTQLRLEHSSTMSTAQRLGCFLLRLCTSGEGQNGAASLQIPVEKHVLASYLGMKPETFSRSQQQLKSLGIDISGARVTIASIARLRHFVCNSCSESGIGSCE